MPLLRAALHRSLIIAESGYIERTTKGVWERLVAANSNMENTIDIRQVTGEARIIFNHMASQNYEGASIFWLRRMAALDGEEAAIEHWQIKRDGKKRGIVEVLKDDT